MYLRLDLLINLVLFFGLSLSFTLIIEIVEENSKSEETK